MSVQHAVLLPLQAVNWPQFIRHNTCAAGVHRQQHWLPLFHYLDTLVLNGTREIGRYKWQFTWYPDTAICEMIWG